MASQVISTAFYGVYIIFSAIHGDKSQSERDHVLRSFREGRTPILVATDVASRGLGMYKVRQKWSHFQLSFARLDFWLWPQNQKITKKKERRIITKKSTWLGAQMVERLVEHSDWTWAKATSDWTLVPDRWKRTRDRPSVRWITWTYLDRWWSRDYYFEPHNSGINCTRSLHAELGPSGFLSERSVWFGISDHFNLKHLFV